MFPHEFFLKFLKGILLKKCDSDREKRREGNRELQDYNIIGLRLEIEKWS